MRKATSARKGKHSRKQVFPRGWDEERVKKVIEYYDNQTEEEEAAEDEAAMRIEGQTVLLVPTELVPEIRRLIARRLGT